MQQAGLATCDGCFSDPEGFEECAEEAAWWESLLNPQPVELEECDEPPFDPDAYLAARFAGGRGCDWCGRGASGHTASLDRFGDPVVTCDAEFEEDPEVVRARNRRWMLGGLG
jgi:hypothetical protein